MSFSTIRTRPRLTNPDACNAAMRSASCVFAGVKRLMDPLEKNLECGKDFRQMVEEISNQLCLTVGGNFDHLIRVDGADDTIEKLEMVVNFVLATASRSIEEVKQAKAQLEEQLDIRRKLEHENAYLREEETRALGEIIGRSPAMRHVSEQGAVDA